MYPSFKDSLKNELSQIKDEGLYKDERVIITQQGAAIHINTGKEVLNFCANNYLGLSSDLRVVDAAISTLESYGNGLSSVRFICGTQDIHKKLEKKLSNFLGMEDTILYAAAFDANGGLFEPLFDHNDAIVSDSLNHASIIDGIRLCKAARFRYKNNDMKDLEQKLIESSNYRNRVIVTDGVFSMDGTIAKLDKICELAKKYNSLVFVDDCHATGFVGKNGKGSQEENNVIGKNTKSAVRSGFFWGYLGLIEKILKLIISRTGKKFKIVMTGGYSHLFKKSLKIVCGAIVLYK